MLALALVTILTVVTTDSVILARPPYGARGGSICLEASEVPHSLLFKTTCTRGTPDGAFKCADRSTSTSRTFASATSRSVSEI